MIEQALSLPEEVLNAPVNIQLNTVDEKGNQTQYVVPLQQVYVLKEDNYVGPSGTFTYTELDAMMFERWATEDPGDETMDDYSLYVRKDQAILYAAPVHFNSPQRQTELLIYSHEHTKPQQEKTSPDTSDTAVPHLRLELE